MKYIIEALNPFFWQVSTAVFQVIEKRPIVSAAGFFEIDLCLIPSVCAEPHQYLFLLGGFFLFLTISKLFFFSNIVGRKYHYLHITHL